MTLRMVRVLGCLLVITLPVMLSGQLVMLGRFLVVLGRLRVMLALLPDVTPSHQPLAVGGSRPDGTAR